ncbi:hypothetical protein RDWZM_001578 [Blomia tropicalis]|uniref:Mitochondrial chaperone BCS1 n=1 Tax=Blomia tropicalis TaxID=40697 RepID=A0A9Q0MDB5_BLOTA|nr:hypothetical protein RDWZM_001578 [Blomia tropicalis]
MTISELVGSLQNNPYFGAGFGLVGLTAALATGRKAAILAWAGIRRYAFVTCEVNSKDKSYQWVLEWITRQSQRTQHVSMVTEFYENEVGRVSTRFAYIPSPGVHFFRYRGHVVRCERVREQMDALAGVPYEVVTLTTLGQDKSVFTNIFNEARRIALAEVANKTATYIAFGHEWRVFGQARAKRPIESVILDNGLSEMIVKDLNTFLESSQWYQERGIPYRRGYLFYGPPGTGKSSFIFSLAGHLNYSICVLNLSDPSLTDDRLLHLVNTAPRDSLILLEDIDCSTRPHQEDQHPERWEGLSRVTYSGLLNTLDGVVGSEARILMMTTNHIEMLDDTLTRPGRVDLKVLIDNATDSQLRRAFLSFFPEMDDSYGDKFVKHVRTSYPKPISMARVQGHFLLHRDNPINVLKNPIL